MCKEGCSPQSSKPCSCPDLRMKKEPGDSDRDINGLLDGGPSCLKQKVPEQHPTVDSRRQTGHGSNLRSSGMKETSMYTGN